MCPHRIVGIAELIAGVWTRCLLDPGAARYALFVSIGFRSEFISI
ncbi:MAG: hypothetical protein R5N71_06050 [Cutibacterium granulosum]|nr:hypothetical protein [Cutibacterium granulosum]MEA5644373.1 hypothetical protein [Cutibacterium granulosum]MEA5648818.1 hypothetical protein [Cutibacterium granulosum]MEA5653719.1 hypothetical protein [Cutibacterium granulosum]MEA5659955.1 hypothetical protein [Cutibacterium granulosum]MEA5661909.1 hypothetical protein [Cutibacterium granulosum]